MYGRQYLGIMERVVNLVVLRPLIQQVVTLGEKLMPTCFDGQYVPWSVLVFLRVYLEMVVLITDWDSISFDSV